MSVKLWAFRDASGRVRITPTDPSAVLGPLGLAVSTAATPGGFSMRDFKRFFATAETTLAGDTGGESYIEFTLDDLDPQVLAALMTPAPV